MIIVNSKVEGDVLIIAISGNLNIDNTFDVEKAFNDNATDKLSAVAFDCKELTTLDSSGLGLFVKFLKVAKNDDFELIFYNITGNILSLFDISKLDNFFTIMDEEQFMKKYIVT